MKLAVPDMGQTPLAPPDRGAFSCFRLKNMAPTPVPQRVGDSGYALILQPLELSPIFGDGLIDQAATVAGGCLAGLAATSSPSANFTPRISFGNWLLPSRRRQVFCAASTSLKTMASAVRFDRQPFDRIVRWRTVANVLSMGFVVRKCFRCSAGKS